jgi:Sulfotransferase domain
MVAQRCNAVIRILSTAQHTFFGGLAMAQDKQPIPDFWLASYPRSGNTYCRIVLNECFDLPVGSVYEESSKAPDSVMSQLCGLQKARPVQITKTHAISEPGTAPAIYLVRDGRASIVSFLHYQRAHGYDTTLQDIILGRVFVGSWSQHYASWRPKIRPNTLLLKYETLTGDPDTAIEMLAGFLNRRPKRKVLHSFADLHKADPGFFRQGSNEKNIAELSADDLSLFNTHHGSVMRSLDYYATPGFLQSAVGWWRGEARA